MDDLECNAIASVSLHPAREAPLVKSLLSPIPRARLVGIAALVVTALAMIGALALALYGAQHVLQTMVT